MPFLLLSQQQELAFSIHNEGHFAPINKILVSTKTKEIITISEDKSIGFWSSEDFSFKEIKHLNGGYRKNGVFYDACFLEDSTHIAIVGNNFSSVDSLNHLYLLKVNDHSITKIATKSSTIFHCASSADGKDLYLADDQNHFEVLSLSNSRELKHQSIQTLPFTINSIAATASGTIYLASDRHQNVFYGDKKAISTSEWNHTTHHFKPIKDLLYAPRHEQIISSGTDQRINIYSKEGKFIRKLCSTEHPVSNILLSHDEHILLVGEENTGNITFYNYDTGDIISSTSYFDNSVFSTAFIEKNSSLLAIASGGSQHEIATINPLLGKQIKQLGGKGSSIKRLYCEDNKLYFSEKENSTQLREYFDFDANRLGRTKGVPAVNSASTQKDAHTIKLGTTKFRTTSQQGRILCATQNETKVFIGTDNYLLVYSRDGKLIQRLEAHLRGIRALCIGTLDEQTYLFSSGEDEIIHLWSLDKDHLPLLPKASLYINFDREWVLWTEKGYFASSENGASLLGFPSKTVVGKDKFSTMAEFFEVLYKPEIVKENLQSDKTLHTILEERNQHEVDLSTIKGASYALIDKFYTIDKSGEKKYLQIRKDGYSTDVSTLYFDVKATDGGAGIKEINLLCNGKLVVTDDSLPHTKLNETISKTYEVQLLPGSNKIEVFAVNYQLRNSSKLGVKIDIEGEVQANAKLFALVIGINEYQNPKNNLNYAYSDALSVKDKLNKVSSSIFSSVEITTLLNNNATKVNIEQAFNDIAKKASPNDVFIFYFAGHGVLIQESDHSEYYLAPADLVQLYDTEEHLNETAFSTSNFKKALSKVKAQKQLVLLDACHSGGAVDKFKTRGTAQEKSIFQLARSSGIVLIAASESKQFATEFEKLGHGVFTYTLLQALSDNAGDISKDKKITVSELKAYMEDQVPEISAKYGLQRQYPTGFSSGQDFPIGVLK